MNHQILPGEYFPNLNAMLFNLLSQTCNMDIMIFPLLDLTVLLILPLFLYSLNHLPVLFPPLVPFPIISSLIDVLN